MLDGATRDHFRNSRIEFLKGIRSLIDERIAHLSREEPQRHARHGGIARASRAGDGFPSPANPPSPMLH